jgi:hypothetical protein
VDNRPEQGFALLDNSVGGRPMFGPQLLDRLGPLLQAQNSALLCGRHHTKVHHGFSVERDDGAPPAERWRTYRPAGTQILTGPAL